MTNRCESCYRPDRHLAVDTTGQRVCPQCFVPPVPRVDADTVFERLFVAPPNAKNVTPRQIA